MRPRPFREKANFYLRSVKYQFWNLAALDSGTVGALRRTLKTEKSKLFNEKVIGLMVFIWFPLKLYNLSYTRPDDSVFKFFLSSRTFWNTLKVCLRNSDAKQVEITVHIVIFTFKRHHG